MRAATEQAGLWGQSVWGLVDYGKFGLHLEGRREPRIGGF